MMVMDFEHLKYELCEGCGEKKADGIFAMITHGCPINTIIYRPGSLKLRHLEQLFTGKRDMDCFDELLKFNYFKPMPDFSTATVIDKIIYNICRESDKRSMKRLRAYLEYEEEFCSKY